MSVARNLFDCISAEDDERFYFCLAKVKDPEELNEVHQVYTPLGLACAFDRWEFVHALLRKGADVNFRTGSIQQYPIHFAAKNDHKGVKCTQLLYEFGADLNAQDADRNTALHHACSMDNILLFNFLMTNSANTNLINVDEETPLIRAILSQNEYMINRLVAAGCDVNYPNGDPLDRLTRFPALMECINLLISNGADIYKQHYLNTAAAYDNVDMMQLLKDRGVDINAASGILDFTALHHACESPRASHKTVEILLDWGADVRSESFTFDTPLHKACQQCNLKKVIFLFDYKPDVNKRNSSLRTPIVVLLTTGFPERDILMCNFFKLFKVLIAAGTKITNYDLDIFHKVVPVILGEMQTEQEVFEFLEMINDYAHQPLSLRDLCRSKVRNCLAPKVGDSVQKLPLPAFLKEFLMFKDIL